MIIDIIRSQCLGLIGCVLFVAAPVAFAADALAEIMSDEDYTAAGLHRLSAAEREHLLLWIERYRAGALAEERTTSAPEARETSTEDGTPTASAAPAGPTRSRAEERVAAPETVQTRIAGEFSGWTGDTIFELENGEVWQQRQPGHLSFHATDPEVILRRNWLGFYSMEVPAAGRSVLVRRLR